MCLLVFNACMCACCTSLWLQPVFALVLCFFESPVSLCFFESPVSLCFRSLVCAHSLALSKNCYSLMCFNIAGSLLCALLCPFWGALGAVSPMRFSKVCELPVDTSIAISYTVYSAWFFAQLNPSNPVLVVWFGDLGCCLVGCQQQGR